RDFRIYQELALHLISIARSIYRKEDSIIQEIQSSIYALDSSTIDLCLEVYPWTPSSKGRAAVKIHTLMDLNGSIPVWIKVSTGRIHDMEMMDQLSIEPYSFYIMDRGYMNFSELNRIQTNNAYFVIRAKKTLAYKEIKSFQVPVKEDILSDREIELKGYRSKQRYPTNIRLIVSRDAKTKKEIALITNNFEIKSETIALCYRKRWMIELFFKWIKQNLKIEKF
ncbi:MAG: IS4 family transposase, partial [Bacteroidota bacterium]